MTATKLRLDRSGVIEAYMKSQDLAHSAISTAGAGSQLVALAGDDDTDERRPLPKIPAGICRVWLRNVRITGYRGHAPGSKPSKHMMEPGTVGDMEVIEGSIQHDVINARFYPKGDDGELLGGFGLVLNPIYEPVDITSRECLEAATTVFRVARMIAAEAEKVCTENEVELPPDIRAALEAALAGATLIQTKRDAQAASRHKKAVERATKRAKKGR